MSRSRMLIPVCLLVFSLCPLVQAKEPAITHKQANKDPDFKDQGEYVGIIGDRDMKYGLRLVAQGKGQFLSRAYRGGLPGDGWDGESHELQKASRQDDGTIHIQGEHATGVVKDGVISVLIDGKEVGKLEKVSRKSKTTKAKPPKGAVVLFDGSSAKHFENGKLDKGLLAFEKKGKGLVSKHAFGSHKLHLEFRTPYMPEARGQGRGNSGLYLQSRYEVQILDSFGLDGKNNECGGIYEIADPKVNMCYPPLVWQTYDIDFTAAEYDSSGQVEKHPRITVRHNGVLVHKDLELPRSTRASRKKPGPDDQPIYLQDHGSPLRYRNIWVVPQG